eukprot:2927668-Amphidinium_carterae.1
MQKLPCDAATGAPSKQRQPTRPKCAGTTRGRAAMLPCVEGAAQHWDSVLPFIESETSGTTKRSPQLTLPDELQRWDIEPSVHPDFFRTSIGFRNNKTESKKHQNGY